MPPEPTDAVNPQSQVPHGIPGLAKTYWAAWCVPLENAAEADMAATLPIHLDWLRSVEERDQLLMAGPLLSGPGVRMGSGIMVFRAADHVAAQDIATQDPFVVAGLRVNTVYEWRLNEGSVSLRVSLSNGSFDWR